MIKLMFNLSNMISVVILIVICLFGVECRSTNDVKYLEPLPRMKGNKVRLRVMGFKYTTRTTRSTTGNLGNKVANYYKDLSNGLWNFKPEYAKEVDLTGNKKLLKYGARDRNKVKNKGSKHINGAPYTIMLLGPSKNGRANAGKGVAYLDNTKLHTALHEVGHLLGKKTYLHLGHAGITRKFKKKKDKKAKRQYDDYGDMTNVQGGGNAGYNGKPAHAAPQLWLLGWLGYDNSKSPRADEVTKPSDDRIPILEFGKEYTIRTATDFGKPGYPAVVYEMPIPDSTVTRKLWFTMFGSQFNVYYTRGPGKRTKTKYYANSCERLRQKMKADFVLSPENTDKKVDATLHIKDVKKGNGQVSFRVVRGA